LWPRSADLIALVVVMFHQDWLFASVAFFVFPSAVIPIVRFGRRVRKASRKTQAQVSRLAGRLTESFQGARHVKAYGMEEYEIRRAHADIVAVRKLVLRTHALARGRAPDPGGAGRSGGGGHHHLWRSAGDGRHSH
jgi:subfamily B ATP-binding cassette protein MsbA